MISDVIINKISIIKRCIERINQVYQGNPHNLQDFTKQDSIILNIQRTCEAAIDLAMHIVAEKELGIPQNSRDGFELLCRNGYIDEQLATRLKAMVGFRNIAVHNYQSINLAVVEKIIESNLADLDLFVQQLLSAG